MRTGGANRPFHPPPPPPPHKMIQEEGGGGLEAILKRKTIGLKKFQRGMVMDGGGAQTKKNI